MLWYCNYIMCHSQSHNKLTLWFSAIPWKMLNGFLVKVVATSCLTQNLLNITGLTVYRQGCHCYMLHSEWKKNTSPQTECQRVTLLGLFFNNCHICWQTVNLNGWCGVDDDEKRSMAPRFLWSYLSPKSFSYLEL